MAKKAQPKKVKNKRLPVREKTGQYFYAPEVTDGVVAFDTFESRHIVRVLRKRKGDRLWITNGKGRLFEAEIFDDYSTAVQAHIVRVKEFEPPVKHLHLFLAPLKSADRMTFALEKAVELGVTSITPVLTRYTERKQIKYERWEKIIISALKQSMRVFKPLLSESVSLMQLEPVEKQRFVALCEASKFENKTYEVSKEAAVLIGPEGGFSQAEKQYLFTSGWKAVSLGKQRLRAETAVVVAVCKFFQND